MVEEDKIADLKLSGADDFLHKPFEIEQLIDRICSLLEIEQMTSAVSACKGVGRQIHAKCVPCPESRTPTLGG